MAFYGVASIEGVLERQYVIVMFVTEDIRATLYTILSTDALLQTHGLLGVYQSQARDDAQFPYIVIGDGMTQGAVMPWDTIPRKFGFDVRLMINIWDLLLNGDTYLYLIEDVYRLLHHPVDELPLTVYHSVDCYCEWMTNVPLPRERVRNIPIRLRLLQQS